MLPQALLLKPRTQGFDASEHLLQLSPVAHLEAGPCSSHWGFPGGSHVSIRLGTSDFVLGISGQIDSLGAFLLYNLPDSSSNDWDDENGNFVFLSSFPRGCTIPWQCWEPKGSFQRLLLPLNVSSLNPGSGCPEGGTWAAFTGINTWQMMSQEWQNYGDKSQSLGDMFFRRSWQWEGMRRWRLIPNIFFSVKSIMRPWRILDIWGSLPFHLS